MDKSCEKCPKDYGDIIEFVTKKIYGASKISGSILVDGKVRTFDTFISKNVKGMVGAIYDFVREVRYSVIASLISNDISVDALELAMCKKHFEFDKIVDQCAYILINLTKSIHASLELIFSSSCFGVFEVYKTRVISVLNGGPCIDAIMLKIYMDKRFSQDTEIINIDRTEWDFAYLKNVKRIDDILTTEYLSTINIVSMKLEEFNFFDSDAVSMCMNHRCVLSVENPGFSRKFTDYSKPLFGTKFSCCVYLDFMSVNIDIVANMKRCEFKVFSDSDPIRTEVVDRDDCFCNIRECYCKKDLVVHDINHMAKEAKKEVDYENMVKEYIVNHYKPPLICRSCDTGNGVLKNECFNCSRSNNHYLPNGSIHKHLRCIGIKACFLDDATLYSFVQLTGGGGAFKLPESLNEDRANRFMFEFVVPRLKYIPFDNVIIDAIDNYDHRISNPAEVKSKENKNDK